MGYHIDTHKNAPVEESSKKNKNNDNINNNQSIPLSVIN